MISSEDTSVVSELLIHWFWILNGISVKGTKHMSKWVLLNANYDTGLQEEANNYNKLWCVHKSPWVSEHPQTRTSDKPMIYLFSCVDSESSAGQIWLHGGGGADTKRRMTR